MPVYDYDLLVLGSGPAGEKGAAQAAYFGHHTGLVERADVLGGTSVNTGTLASKTLRESALFLSGFRSRQLYGLETTVRKDITLADFMHRRYQVQDREQQRVACNLERHAIERIHGQASLLEPHLVQVQEPGGQTRRISAEFILLATGSAPHRPPEIPFNPDNIFDSDTVLQMQAIPASLLVIGGGVIGCEYACLFSALGLDVTLVDGRERLLPFLDFEISDALANRMRQMGIRLLLADALRSMQRDGKAVRTQLRSGQECVTESVLYAAGRTGNTAGLGLENVGLAVNKRGYIEVDPLTYQTAVPSIYAAGDVIGFPALASTSMEQARVAVCHAFNLTYKQRVSPILPYGIYTIPEVSFAGETEESCRQKNIPYLVGRSLYGQHARGQIIGDTEGLIKLIAEAPSGKLLGVHVIGEIASEIVHVGMACLYYGGDIDFFIQSVFNYPTLGDIYKYAAYDALGQLNKVRAAAPPAPVPAAEAAAV